ncbi:hypothetical protein BY458DRAFT_433771 [Sporodiniella umbellata]|nr:hypothetical protein BY458DRAFT_433771 [Sporodiniella umbellata]
MNAPIYYLRFLKPPPQEYNLGEPFTLVWTIESDLGDVTCFESIPVQCRLETAGKAKLAHCPKKALGWTEPTDKDITLVFDPFQGGGMVSQFRIEEAVSPGELRLHLFVNSSRSHPVWTGAGLYADLWLVPVWSRPIAVCKHERRRLASGGDQTERKLTLQSGSTLTVCEDAVESIARHVWDCGLGMCQYLQEHLSDFQRYQCLLELG